MDKFYMRLPRNKLEFVLFTIIISLISVNIIAPVVVFLQNGFSLDIYVDLLKSLPFIWIGLVILMFSVYMLTTILTNKILKKDDSFNAHILVSTLLEVFIISIILTLVAPMIVNGEVSTKPIEQFIYIWPSVFTIAFGVELLIAQPIARGILYLVHKAKDKKVQNNSQNVEEVTEPIVEDEEEEKVLVSEYKSPEPIFNKESNDVLFIEALRSAIETGNISVSLLQRQYSIGYGRAKKIVDKMEELKYISKPKGETFKRKVLITKEQFEEKFTK